LPQLKQLLADPAARSELRKELAFYGLLNDVLGLFEISPEAESAARKGILQLSPLAAISLLIERWIPVSLRSARAVVAGCVLLACAVGLVIWYEHPRPLGVISQAGAGLRIRRAGQELLGSGIQRFFPVIPSYRPNSGPPRWIGLRNKRSFSYPRAQKFKCGKSGRERK